MAELAKSLSKLTTDDSPEPGNSDWVDATEEFRNACSQLETGELVMAKEITLFDTLLAVEFMDPRLDTGAARSTHKVTNFGEAVKMISCQHFQIVRILRFGEVLFVSC
ncbi:Mak10 domain containing protein [Trichuris trichiura]|uniref:Mak10 domain containing protein n=1 Tax=Trichuris trichiura TaxID=36087 RepID=A0A077ZEX8_TRITR|nr:Mak10 domain containing protein [Trichuris trichiura]